MPVALRHLYDATLLADEDLTLNLVDFGREVIEPQVAVGRDRRGSSRSATC